MNNYCLQRMRNNPKKFKFVLKIYGNSGQIADKYIWDSGVVIQKVNDAAGCLTVPARIKREKNDSR